MNDPSKKTGTAAAVAATALGGFLAYDANLYPKLLELVTPAEVATEAVVTVDAWQSAETFTRGVGETAGVLQLGPAAGDVIDALPLDSAAVFPRLAISDTAGANNGSLLMVRMPQLNPVVVQQPGQSSAMLATAITDDAQPAILSDLARDQKTLTLDEATAIIQSQLNQAAAKAAGETSKVRFELLTGKLEITPKFNVLGVEMAFGEVNLYKISAIAGAGVMACKGLSSASFSGCAAKALSKAATFIVEAKADEKEAGAK